LINPSWKGVRARLLWLCVRVCVYESRAHACQLRERARSGFPWPPLSSCLFLYLTAEAFFTLLLFDFNYTPGQNLCTYTRARMHAHTVCLDKLSQTKIVPVKGNYKMQFLLILFPIHLMNSTAAAATTRAYTCTHVCVCECVFDLVYKCLFKSPVYVHHRLM